MRYIQFTITILAKAEEDTKRNLGDLNPILAKVSRKGIMDRSQLAFKELIKDYQSDHLLCILLVILIHAPKPYTLEQGCRRLTFSFLFVSDLQEKAERGSEAESLRFLFRRERTMQSSLHGILISKLHKSKVRL